MRRLPAALAVTAALGMAAACDRADRPASVRPRRCEIPLSVPAGFRASGGIEDPHQDRIGVRIDLESDDGRELHYFSGIRGEFGEGLAAAGEVRLADGGTGRLAGSGTTWVLEWASAPPCTPTVVLGTGMRRGAFRDALREAGALAEP